MAKRFTATEKWDDPWYLTLYWQDKLFWDYLLCKCDNCGIWQVYWPEVKLKIAPNFEFRPEVFGDRVRILNEEKWWIPKFIEFQYGVLVETCRPHQAVIEKLKKDGLWKILSKGYLKGIRRVSDTLTDTDTDSVNRRIPTNSTTTDKGDTQGGVKHSQVPSLQEVSAYCQERKRGVDAQRFHDFYASKGWMIGKNKMKDWRAAVRTWEKNERQDKPQFSPIYHDPFPDLPKLKGFH